MEKSPIWLYPYAIRHPMRVLCAAAIITAAIAPGITRLELRTDGHALVPTHAPQIAVDRGIREEFDVEDPIVLVIRSEHPNGIFNAHTLALVQNLTDDLSQLEGIRPVNLFSLATEHGDRVLPGTLKFRRFLNPLPKTQEQLERLRNDLKAIELYTGTLVSYDEAATSIMVSIPPSADRLKLYGTICETVAARQPLPEKINVIGAPVAEALLGTHILEDLGVPTSLLGHRTFGSVAGDEETFLPRNLHEVRVFLARHIGLVPLALLIMCAVFVVSFRSFYAALLPLGEVGACLLVVLGLMGWSGVPVYLTIAVMPVILTAIGVADEIHIFRRYADEFREHPKRNHIEAVQTTMTEMSVPVVKTSITTAIGFLSFTLSPIAAVRAFGLFTSLGILFCMVWSLTVIPAMLTLIKPQRLGIKRRTPPSDQTRPPILTRLVTTTLRHRKTVVVLSLLVVLASAAGIRRVVVQDSWIDGFAPASEFRKATQYFNEQFLGTHILLVRVDAGHQLLSGELPGSAVDHKEIRLPANLIDEEDSLVGQRLRLRHAKEPSAFVDPATGKSRLPPRRLHWTAHIENITREDDSLVIETGRRNGSPKLSLRCKDSDVLLYEITPERLGQPELIKLIGELEDFLEGHRADAVGGVLGTADYIRTINFMGSGRKEEKRCIPESRARVEWLWAQYGRIRGKERLAQIVDTNLSRSLVTVFLKDANFVATQHLLDDIEKFENERLQQHGLSLTIGGDVAVSQTLIKAIVKTQVTSLLVSLLGVFLVTSLLNRSLRWGFYCVLPCAIAVSVNFAVMGFVGVPLGVATSMFAGMTLGIGVDFAIHLLERFRLTRARGLEVHTALMDAVSSTGPAILIDAIAVALSFGVLTLSQVPANARLGGLLVLSILGCLTATLVLLPVLVRMGVQSTPHYPDA